MVKEGIHGMLCCHRMHGIDNHFFLKMMRRSLFSCRGSTLSARQRRNAAMLGRGPRQAGTRTLQDELVQTTWHVRADTVRSGTCYVGLVNRILSA